jgi:hypothetical protein
MPRPRKYKTDAERFRAYRERKRVKEETLRREVYLLSASAKRRKPSPPIPGSDQLRQALLKLRKEIPPRRKAADGLLGPNQWVLDWIEMAMDRLLGIEHHL